ncbi:MAG: UDP-4-amino-4,6-dideoxy-N-acetyl-beta-L-altrosamine transaminase [Flavobacterium sp.]|nr:MAG: UDP-4-amino-4,6-dideoxy-N-acetyl-beta-L-altrosamine transaminase [Flavobacterium sp.]
MTSLIPYGRQEITEADIAAVVSTLKSDFLTQGPAIERFEKGLGEYIGAKHVVAVSNGTAGLHIAYLAANLGKGDAVIVPAITFAATSNAALYCGATPVFADVLADSGCIDPESVERCIILAKSEGLNPKVIAPVHFAGRPCDMQALTAIASRHNLLIIEDACHAYGAEYRNSSFNPMQKVGSAEWTSMSILSFHPVKHITTGEGGAVLTQDGKLAHKLRQLRSHGITKNAADYVNSSRAIEDGMANPWYHEMQILGLNYRMCDIQAALGDSQVQRSKEMIKRRREIAATYDDAFRNHKYLKPAAGDSENGLHSYHLYPVQVDFKALNTTRARFSNSLRELGVGSQVHYLPVPWHPFYEQNQHLWASDKLLNAPKIYEQELSIPMFPSMSNVDVSKVIESILGLIE